MSEDLVPGSAGWWTQRNARDARRRPRPDGLSVERIIKVALVVVDEEGLDALTVRRLADELATGSASLYRHVASRDELLVLIVDDVLGEMVYPPATLGGRAKVESLAGELRRVLMAHPRLLPALTASPLQGPNALRGVEHGLTYLLEMGYEPATAIPACMALIDYVLGTVYFDTSRAGRDRLSDGTIGVLGALPTQMVPALLAPWDPDEVFRFGLTAFLEGLDQRAPLLEP
jgi:AcrR family transcriptional regulator